MFGQNIRKLIIVCDDQTHGYGNYLRQLVSTNDDDNNIVGTKDGSIGVAVWLEKDYLANMATITSDQHVLFIGENQASKNEISSMNVKFDSFGMKYGWLGKRGMMIVSKTIDNPEEYNEFIELCRNYKTEFEPIEFKKSLPEQAIDAAVGAMGDIPNVISNVGNTVFSFLVGSAPAIVADTVNAVAEATKWITTTDDQRKITDQQFRALTLILYMDGLSEFLEG
ncbi:MULTISPECIES: hypothetical protein [Streptococcus]|uniref:hypothetical protein n=1 Tax=Streptococcus TaxID=1301 RepID=UPI00066A39A6|nr:MULTISPECIES: hypothetical protein [Streptococcus]